MVCTKQLSVTAICLETNMLNGLILAVKYGALRAKISASSQKAAAICQACLKVSIAEALAFSGINHTNTHFKLITITLRTPKLATLNMQDNFLSSECGGKKIKSLPRLH